jgi:SRSO17 transposase
MLRGERKSVEPIAAVTAPARVAAQHQSLRHFVGEGRGRTSAFWPRGARWFCLRSSVKACAAGLPRGVALVDAGYGNNSNLRADITSLGLSYVAGILSNTTVWADETRPLPPKPWSGRARPTKRLRRDAEHRPISVKELALGLPKRAWRTIEWRESSAETLSSRFARVRAARRDEWRHEPRPEE